MVEYLFSFDGSNPPIGWWDMILTPFRPNLKNLRFTDDDVSALCDCEPVVMQAILASDPRIKADRLIPLGKIPGGLMETHDRAA